MSTEKRNLTCINCPLGCQIEVTLEDGAVTAVTGNSCPRGGKYARKEVTDPRRVVTTSVTDPRRVVTTSVAVTGSREGARTVSVRTAGDVPKGSVMDVVRALRGVAVRCPVKIGDVILEDAAGTGVAVVATKNAD